MKNKYPYVTVSFLVVNFILFWLQIQPMYNKIAPEITTLFMVSPDIFLSGEYYRLITASFIHGSDLHLIYNMFSLAVCGLLLESKMNRYVYLFSLLTIGIAGNLLWAVYGSGPALGFSGISYGIIFLTIFYYSDLIKLILGNAVAVGLKYVALAYVLVEVYVMVYYHTDTAHFIHLGGMGAGAVIGIILSVIRPKLKLK